ncbi:efflux transporter, RND family, MFP subunit [Arcobacter nitrofigilis DSM 7299]|uniref:Efflux transporter, RND family, MFP subunit n=1 Tax=Arcobacter nitrofigilis (strain ATCC 33309 / DSM 7299 / CCUG 15893 / LMG 7604 / NCTC 12251 / CI) TaxID=572480 RepID=D5V7Q2_ARCNC|nr:efflux RND transporter periplasmic adaptor subunit [Arcobacter nitrofigilis]ADG94672.1 efflux transporter, RND family, MFP subunit [Arcobacter nitrofigilis DSM 7299]
MKKILVGLFILGLNFLFAAGQQMPPLPVKAYTVNTSETIVEKDYPALIKSKSEVNIIARVPGKLVKKYFNDGDFVKKGTLLYKIEQDTYQANLNAAQAQLDKAEALLTKATKDWKRAEKLFASKSISEQSKDDYLYTYQDALADVKNYKAKVQDAKINYQYTLIRSPINGLTGKSAFDEGNYVGSNENNSKLLTITNTNPVYIEFSLPQKDIAKYLDQIKKGSVSFSISANGKTYSDGKLNFVSSKIDIATDSLLLRTTFGNKNNELIIGGYSTIEIKNIKIKNVFTIPEIAILQSANGAAVYVIENGVATIRPIKIGNLTSSGVLVKSGLKAGDKIIISNIAKVRPNAPVQIIGDK